jgi:hypothetical protein
MGKSSETTSEWWREEDLAADGRRKTRAVADDGASRRDVAARGGPSGRRAGDDGRRWAGTELSGKEEETERRRIPVAVLNGLFSTARVWPPKIRCYFRSLCQRSPETTLFSAALSMATKNNIIFGDQSWPPKITEAAENVVQCCCAYSSVKIFSFERKNPQL